MKHVTSMSPTLVFLGVLCWEINLIIWEPLLHVGCILINGDFFGGIYATRIANFLGTTIHEDDIEFPPAYLDYEAMVRHQFVERND